MRLFAVVELDPNNWTRVEDRIRGAGRRGGQEWDGHGTCRLRRVPCKDGPGRGEGVGDGERSGLAAHAGTILMGVPRTGRLSA